MFNPSGNHTTYQVNKEYELSYAFLIDSLMKNHLHFSSGLLLIEPP